MEEDFGYVQDVEADFETGNITAIIVPGTNKMFTLGNKNDVIIPWDKIVRIGDDIILVEIWHETRGMSTLCGF